MNILAGESDVKKHSQKTSERDGEPRQCYVYEIRIDGVVRYIGKGATVAFTPTSSTRSVPLAGPKSRLAIYLRIFGKC